MENGAQYPVLQYKVFTLRLKQQGHPETVLNDMAGFISGFVS
jgi:hypothetical protein